MGHESSVEASHSTLFEHLHGTVWNTRISAFWCCHQLRLDVVNGAGDDGNDHTGDGSCQNLALNSVVQDLLVDNVVFNGVVGAEVGCLDHSSTDHRSVDALPETTDTTVLPVDGIRVLAYGLLLLPLGIGLHPGFDQISRVGERSGD